MAKMSKIVVVSLLLAAVVLAAAGGCTVRFKASDVELDSVSNATFELQSMSLFDGSSG